MAMRNDLTKFFAKKRNILIAFNQSKKLKYKQTPRMWIHNNKCTRKSLGRNRLLPILHNRLQGKSLPTFIKDKNIERKNLT